MGKHKNTVLIQAIYGAFLRGDVPAILDKLADNIEWKVGSPIDGVPMFGTFKGKAGVQQFLQNVRESSDIKVFEPGEYISQYDKVAVTVHMELVIKKTGKPVAQDTVMVWTVQDGKVTKLRGYEDTAAVASGFAGG